MQEFSPMQRACFELVAMRGVSIGEVAGMHNLSESTVRQHLFRARTVLSRALSPESEDGQVPGKTGAESTGNPCGRYTETEQSKP
jgi:DNA-directed RNA polymerase specialized sigma24 family protein